MRSVAEKRDYYRQPGVVDRYERWRFGSPGGRHAGEREVAVVLDCLASLPRSSRILDLPVGTGRLSAALLAAGFERVFGADASDAMLGAARRACDASLLLGMHDAFATAYRDGAFDAVASLRFLFHFAEYDRLLGELGRTVRPGGLLVFDTLRWSPRRRASAVQAKLGGVVYPEADETIAAALARHGFTVMRRERILLLPSLAYRYLPGPGVRAVDWLEQRLPDRLRTKTVWCARKELSRGG